ncbi:MAG: hypothetical protein MMC23_010072 [Stictis urceolatum]|nr:hypothetical protein [Stictis urceolata]
MSRTAAAINGSPLFNTAQLDDGFLVRWAGWIGVAVKALTTYMTGLIYYDMHTRSSVSTSPTIARTSEKEYRINDRGRVLKRSLRQDEYFVLDDGEPIVPLLVVERLKNDAACMAYIREHTDIPVPKLLDTYEKDGSFYLWMEFVNGVEMNKLTEKEQIQLLPQIRNIVAALQKLRSNYSGGPTGILSPPSVIYFHHFSQWAQQYLPEKEFVFCHGDLAQGNILVDRETLKIVAVIDWEYGGFFPPELEIPFYESSEHSGIQVKSNSLKPAVDYMIEFWRQSESLQAQNQHKVRGRATFYLS